MNSVRRIAGRGKPRMLHQLPSQISDSMTPGVRRGERPAEPGTPHPAFPLPAGRAAGRKETGPLNTSNTGYRLG